ncbi:hypothetical protein FRX31_029591, partial [Thalictrum thalictroides]
MRLLLVTKLLFMILQFFNEGDYETASFCFKRSGDVYRWKWAKAASLQMEGQNKWHTDLGRARTCLSEAAEKYEEIGKLESAATCFMKLGNFAKACKLQSGNNTRHDFLFPIAFVPSWHKATNQ